MQNRYNCYRYNCTKPIKIKNYIYWDTEFLIFLWALSHQKGEREDHQRLYSPSIFTDRYLEISSPATEGIFPRGTRQTMHWLITDCTQWDLLLTFVTVEKSDRVVQQNPLTSTLILARKPTCTGLKHFFCSWLWLLLLPPSQNTCSLLNHFSSSSSVSAAITPNSEIGRLQSCAST